ncbi:MAG: hypothetical protein H6706_03710 [Myxococcales bacterium]|nr:hypothetical protein [Myxococcales bacterium]
MKPAWVLALGLAACGVPGRPLPPGPVAPRAPADVQVVSTPAGLEISAERPTRDLDGEPVPEPPSLLVFVDDAACRGVPAGVAATGPVVVPRPAGEVTLRVVAAVGGRQGPPAEAVRVAWAPGPPPPDAPLAFLTPDRKVQLAWLPPDAPAGVMRILRDDRPVGVAPASAARFVDAAPPGPHRYRLEAVVGAARSAPSAPADVVVPP